MGRKKGSIYRKFFNYLTILIFSISIQSNELNVYIDSNQKIKAYELIQNSDYSLINIWASWCLPCRDEHPILINLQDKKKLNLIGINYKDKKKNSIKFLNELGNPYDTIIIDKNGLISVSLGAYGVPETYLVNRNYKILKRYVGPLNQENVTELFEIINENL